MSIVPPESLYFRLQGPDVPNKKPPLVLLHGLMGFAANWGKIWPHFREQRQVLVFDQRGHGKSAKPNSGYSPTDYAQDLKALLEHLHLSECHIVGHSMGGRVALRFASLFPEHCRTLTMEDSGAEARPDRLQWITNLLGGIPTPFASREQAKAFFEQNFRDDPLTGSFLHANLETNAEGQLNWRFHAPGMIETVQTGRVTDSMREFTALTIPTLLFRGARSKEFTADEAERMQKSRANMELVTIPDAGHYVHAEQPLPFSQALESFISAHD
ncbi:MAG: alpha/beta fold hydrolase [Bdellovibrionota bacterium]